MWRQAMQKLEDWKDSPTRRPLLLRGARQVGKTWLLRDLGRRYYDRTAYIRFNIDSKANDIFDNDLDIKLIVRELSNIAKIEILPGNTLIVLDDIQWCPKALAALKTFADLAPEYHVAAAGSFLDVIAPEETKVAESAVEVISIYPMTFLEYLKVDEDSSRYAKILESRDLDRISESHDSIMTLLEEFFLVGGMPAAVAKFIESGKDSTDVKWQHDAALNAFHADFARYMNNRTMAARAYEIWENVPKQLKKVNKRFLYSDLKPGSRGRDFQAALEWMKKAKMIHALHRVRIPHTPLGNNMEQNIFKLYLPDIGLLCARCGYHDWRISSLGGGAAEQFVFQELLALDDKMSVSYWSSAKNYVEIEFVLQVSEHVVPIELSIGGRRKAHGLKIYREEFDPKITVKMTESGFKQNGNNIELPLYMVYALKNLMQ
jgi:predicted AAA+ superfamily ATPase